MPGPLGTQRKRSHSKIWMVALLLALAIAGVVYALLDKDAYHQTTILIMLVMGGLALWFAIAVLFYLSGAFSEISTEGAGWVSGKEEIARRPVRRMERPRSKSTQEQGLSIPVVINRDRRACTGDLILTSHRLYFICYQDESVAKAMGGKAVAQQFGILGALVLSLMTKKSGKRKEAEIEQARAESRNLPLEDRAVRHPLSLSLAASQVTRFSHGSISGTRLEVGEKKYSFLEIDKGVFPMIKSWCDQNGIETKGI
ncbi:hypothetical protein ACFL2F_01985 [Myxococcota bacterium]